MIKYTTGPAGQMVIDWKAESENYPQTNVIWDHYPDKRDNRNPEEVYLALKAERENGKPTYPAFDLVKEAAKRRDYSQ
jgi:hypothetical protein